MIRKAMKRGEGEWFMEERKIRKVKGEWLVGEDKNEKITSHCIHFKEKKVLNECPIVVL